MSSAPGAGTFILLGHHRSGTSFINHLVRRHPRFESMNEPLGQHLQWFRDHDLEPLSASPSAGRSELSPETDEYLDELQAWLAAESTISRGFKETTVSFKLEWLRARLPVDRYVVIVRDPRAVAASVVRRRLHTSWWDYRGRLLAYVAASGAQPPVDLMTADGLGLTAASWSMRARDALDFARQVGAKIIRLEDVLDPSLDDARHLMEHLGAALSPSQSRFLADAWSKDSGQGFTHAYSYQRDPSLVRDQWRKTIDDDQERALVAVARLEMEELGYLP